MRKFKGPTSGHRLPKTGSKPAMLISLLLGSCQASPNLGKVSPLQISKVAWWRTQLWEQNWNHKCLRSWRCLALAGLQLQHVHVEGHLAQCSTKNKHKGCNFMDSNGSTCWVWGPGSLSSDILGIFSKESRGRPASNSEGLSPPKKKHTGPHSHEITLTRGRNLNPLNSAPPQLGCWPLRFGQDRHGKETAISRQSCHGGHWGPDLKTAKAKKNFISKTKTKLPEVAWKLLLVLHKCLVWNTRVETCPFQKMNPCNHVSTSTSN